MQIREKLYDIIKHSNGERPVSLLRDIWMSWEKEKVKMILIVTVDDDNGMMFNNRRQSRDKAVVERILTMTEGGKLWMNAYSKKLFDDAPQIVVDENFLEKAGRREFCFAENVLPDEKDVELVIVFRWNRRYPGDFHFNYDLSKWSQGLEEEFKGNSHEKITMEVYKNAAR